MHQNINTIVPHVQNQSRGFNFLTHHLLPSPTNPRSQIRELCVRACINSLAYIIISLPLSPSISSFPLYISRISLPPSLPPSLSLSLYPLSLSRSLSPPPLCLALFLPHPLSTLFYYLSLPPSPSPTYSPFLSFPCVLLPQLINRQCPFDILNLFYVAYNKVFMQTVGQKTADTKTNIYYLLHFCTVHSLGFIVRCAFINPFFITLFSSKVGRSLVNTNETNITYNVS